MHKFNKYHALVLFLLAALLSVTPLLSSSIRTTYIYFIINFLIIALGAEAGVISALSNPSYDDQNPNVSTIPFASLNKESVPITPDNGEKNVTQVVDKCVSEKIAGSVNVVKKVKKCPSMPSLFFLGCGDDKREEDGDVGDDHGEEEADVGALSGQELFTKAESFIGNFYKQLKMQREDSWKKIHGLYHKAF